mgnify:CR=1 FL=1|tara:strand:- start:2025 stop:2975 length:951 start_codon:yes stop_codon:yes gene_type:complete
MKIIITGSAGFIGYHLAKNLLKNKRNQVLGIDSINSYYSKTVKNLRIKLLKKNKNFIFKKTNLVNESKIDLIFKKFKPEAVFHIAGQPGVLYSFKNPKSYKKNNIDATKIISLVTKKYDVKKFIFASSSSVYGDQKKFPIKENFKLNPKNYYAQTKLKCEEIINKNFLFSNTKYIMYRFFTVYGPLGRPDMFIHKFLNSIKHKKKIYMHNNGLNYRDFTFIDDLIKILIMTLKKMPKRKLLNICRSKPIKTTKLVSLINKIYGYKQELVNTGFVRGEMLKTHGCNKLLKSNFKRIKFFDIEYGLKKTISAFKKFGY